MIMHVAEAGEQRGRVVLHITSGHPNSVALEAAVRIAQAFHSEIESLFVEDLQLYDMASYPFAREISLTGSKSRALSRDAIERDLRLAGRALCRRVEALAQEAKVPLRTRVVRDDPMQALAKACAEDGPWNVVALADVLAPGQGTRLSELFANVGGYTGLMLVGPKARRTRGPVIAVIESPDHLTPMLRAAERMSSVTGGIVMAMLLSDNAHDAQHLEEQTRLALGDHAKVLLLRCQIDQGAPAALAEAIRRLHGGFLIAHFGGILVPAHGDLRDLVAALECPLFLMR
jgi:hypothetical protein